MGVLSRADYTITETDDKIFSLESEEFLYFTLQISNYGIGVIANDLTEIL